MSEPTSSCAAALPHCQRSRAWAVLLVERAYLLGAPVGDLHGHVALIDGKRGVQAVRDLFLVDAQGIAALPT